MAVAASHFARGNLAGQGFEAVATPRELHYCSPLLAYMVMFQEQGIGLAAIDATRG